MKGKAWNKRPAGSLKKREFSHDVKIRLHCQRMLITSTLTRPAEHGKTNLKIENIQR